jgi:hypothetical protein
MDMSRATVAASQETKTDNNSDVQRRIRTANEHTNKDFLSSRSLSQIAVTNTL